GAASDAGFFGRDERHGLLSCRQLRTDKRRCEVLQRQALHAIDDRCGEILVAQTSDPLRELSAERLGGRGVVGRDLWPGGGLGDRRWKDGWNDARGAPRRETRTEEAPAIDVHGRSSLSIGAWPAAPSPDA